MEKKNLKELLEATFDMGFESMIHKHYLENDDYIDKDDNSYHLHISLPGLLKEDLKIVATKDFINLSADKTNSKFIKSFNKKYLLPKDVDVDNIMAKLENGVCHIEIPKDKTKSGERLIQIN